MSEGKLVLVSLVTLIMSIVARSARFKNFVSSVFSEKVFDKDIIINSPTLKLTSHIPLQFESGNVSTFKNLKQTLRAFEEYGIRARDQNNILISRANGFDAIVHNQLRVIGYFDKLDGVQDGINRNTIVTKKIIKTILSNLTFANYFDSSISNDWKLEIKRLCDSFGYRIDEQSKVLVQIPDHKVTCMFNNPLSRVIESISHLCKDYSENFEIERKPIIKFIKGQLDKLDVSSNDLLVVPGSGAGFLSWQLATSYQNVKVDSIELSGLMYLTNLFAMNYKEKDIRIYPFVQFYSGQKNLENQLLEMHVPLERVKKPENLNPLWGDFTVYMPVSNKHDKIFVITAYFIDTAEDLIEYVKAIEALKKYCKKVHWINVGPLKYGTQPKIQLNGEELARLRKIRGWTDTFESYSNDCEGGLNGYLTDTNSLYQGYYGHLQFHSYI
ncbi:hypothetical protein KAFR_0B03190 [Kazachstania africana CBS 2517]|uniref:Uncharacterized protein n=1 Tax=Kazachstania africana (strain ATCC 22294 / BCRC 22015 / CBS 2517 / CECT 1963 / NBRC 1671 / NRRL Y-8276) TaxID=1071382 RepID=H2AQG5_KAZAF|nr:hypothetical protein KAFR_0B03190 [Kazachstania africana CBS 2517]CCF56615.1 hypothetical protein KAFR_0B03190 [Kazachstania africana CBS 2517]